MTSKAWTTTGNEASWNGLIFFSQLRHAPHMYRASCFVEIFCFVQAPIFLRQSALSNLAPPSCCSTSAMLYPLFALKPNWRNLSGLSGGDSHESHSPHVDIHKRVGDGPERRSRKLFKPAAAISAKPAHSCWRLHQPNCRFAATHPMATRCVHGAIQVFDAPRVVGSTHPVGRQCYDTSTDTAHTH